MMTDKTIYYKGTRGPLRNTCSHCQASHPNLLLCHGCLVHHYCSREHQVAHWPQHCSMCLCLRDERELFAEDELEADGPYDWENMDLPHLDIRNADILEHPAFLLVGSRVSTLSQVSTVLLLKLKLLVDVRHVRAARDVSARWSLPPELCRLIDAELVRSPLWKRFFFFFGQPLARLEATLVGQSRALGAVLVRVNAHPTASLLEPEGALNTPPQPDSRDPWQVMATTMRNGLSAWWETEGVLEMMSDARARAASDLEGKLKGPAEEETAYEPAEPSTYKPKKPLNEAGANRLWSYL